MNAIDIDIRKAAAREKMRRWRAANPERAKEIDQKHEKKRLAGGDKHEERKLYRRNYRERNKSRINARTRERYSRDPEKWLGPQRKKYADTPEKFVEKVKKWKQLNPEKAKAWANARSRRNVESLSDAYVASKLSRGTTLLKADFPQELVELKRMHLKIHRQLENDEP